MDNAVSLVQFRPKEADLRRIKKIQERFGLSNRQEAIRVALTFCEKKGMVNSNAI